MPLTPTLSEPVSQAKGSLVLISWATLLKNDMAFI